MNARCFGLSSDPCRSGPGGPARPSIPEAFLFSRPSTFRLYPAGKRAEGLFAPLEGGLEAAGLTPASLRTNDMLLRSGDQHV